ncbi:hypothetical protein BDY21DRAFT_19809 [Lineolata rhizophorae]|uniref:Uncharacterized protein n=1 Tax=Lineolata rhizophorae TaxID=578093 RepID=A0A6A6P225_9PEZI|nr:hypothetical protein BDY21DRAFT_19809 [Lineolata rhizophorae]
MDGDQSFVTSALPPRAHEKGVSANPDRSDQKRAFRLNHWQVVALPSAGRGGEKGNIICGPSSPEPDRFQATTGTSPQGSPFVRSPRRRPGARAGSLARGATYRRLAPSRPPEPKGRVVMQCVRGREPDLCFLIVVFFESGPGDRSIATW